MIFNKTVLEGVYMIELEKIEDDRGFFARMWDGEEFAEQGLNNNLAQCSISLNKKKGTIRGLHYQSDPCQEVKLVTCLSGRIFDVVLDLRPNSTTFKKWISIELTSDNYKMCYIPEGFAHGFQTLEDNVKVFYQMSKKFVPDYYRGVKWNDPTFNIKWPMEPTIISKKDSSFPLFELK